MREREKGERVMTNEHATLIELMNLATFTIYIFAVSASKHPNNNKV